MQNKHDWKPNGQYCAKCGVVREAIHDDYTARDKTYDYYIFDKNGKMIAETKYVPECKGYPKKIANGKVAVSGSHCV